MSNNSAKPLVAILMGSKNDWEIMQAAGKIFDEFGVAYEAKVASAHRSPELVASFVKSAESRGLEVIIGAAGLAAHLPGVIASMTLLPVLGVPMHGNAVGGLDALLAIAQMPGGVPVGTLAIGSHGAKNSALLAIRILANSRPELRQKLSAYHEQMAKQIENETLLSVQS
ncbi:MAG TPA: 5-(carboxyamino)imidazole ribonucleotide mutase [Lacipirellulaceae bacterium]|nr:5-(carboxyamino)imidazole ribonucleotide mutase [Lacipirellulaceae bacterium]